MRTYTIAPSFRLLQLLRLFVWVLYTFFKYTTLDLMFLCLYNYYPHRVLCRAKLIPFVHELRYNLLATRVINHAFDDAPSALPSLLHLGSKLSDMEPHALQSIMSKIQEAIPTLDSRILMKYTLTLASALVVGGTSCMYLFFNYIISVGLTWCEWCNSQWRWCHGHIPHCLVASHY